MKYFKNVWIVLMSFMSIHLTTCSLLACTELPKTSQTEAKLKSVLFQRGETKEFCLKLPQAELKPLQNKFVEWHTVNLGNASCGVLRMKVVRPNKNDIEGKMSKRREISQSVQPGAVLVYTQGKWRAKYTLIEPCRPGLDRWDLGVSWSVK
ncbi:MAG TPA: hypothetical protein PKW79_00120 [Rhabdochlamydiaceae bacterium]|nr:hypothetical protein [Rhabdochlamydiaceae bacterium]